MSSRAGKIAFLLACETNIGGDDAKSIMLVIIGLLNDGFGARRILDALERLRNDRIWALSAVMIGR